MANESTRNMLNAGITVSIGGVDVTFKPLPINDDMEWRKTIGAMLASVVRQQRINVEDVNSDLLLYFFTDGLDELIASVFMLADRQLSDVAAMATRAEIGTAIGEVFRAYYLPFVSSIIGIWAAMKPGG